MKYINQYNKIKELEPRKRGFEFEKLMNKICDDQDILLSDSYKTADTEQQIDGAVEINSKIFLVESKWEKQETLSASKLFIFLGKISSKIEGTIGIFISHNELSENFISSVRNGLRQSCIVIHGEENIMDIINGKVNVKDFIWYTYQQASTKNRSFINTSEFQSLPRKSATTVDLQSDVEWKEISKKLLDSSTTDIFVTNLETNYRSDIDLSQKTLNVFTYVYTNALRQEKFIILVKKCLSAEKESFKDQLIQRLKSKRWTEYVKYSFLDTFTNEFENISNDDKEKILENAVNHIEAYLGLYDEENKASELIKFLFKHLNEDDIKRLANVYLDIYCDTFRMEKFLQKKISNKIFNKLNDNKLTRFDVVKQTILSKLEDEKRDEYIHAFRGINEEKQKESTVQYILQKYRKVIDDQEACLNLLRDEYDKL